MVQLTETPLIISGLQRQIITKQKVKAVKMSNFKQKSNIVLNRKKDKTYIINRDSNQIN